MLAVVKNRGNRSAQRNRKTTFGVLIRDPAWQAMGAVVTLLIAIVPVAIAFVANRESDPEVSQSARASASVGNLEDQVEGNCNGVGNGVTVTCNSGPKSMANIAVTMGMFVGMLWFSGKPTDLPVPPDTSSFRCLDWESWIYQTEGIHFSQSVANVEMLSGDPDFVALTDVRVTIMERTTQAEDTGTWIKCAWGGGSSTGYIIETDTNSMTTTVATYDNEGGLGPANKMPPAAITLDTKERADATIEIKSIPGYRYEGYLTVRNSMNGKTEELTIGSHSQPLRWMTSALEGASQDFYGWDPKVQRWVHNFDPYEN